MEFIGIPFKHKDVPIKKDVTVISITQHNLHQPIRKINLFNL